jgi:hypothetical protein
LVYVHRGKFHAFPGRSEKYPRYPQKIEKSGLTLFSGADLNAGIAEMPDPAPLVPSEVDLRGTAWMPYFGHLLRGSELNAVVSDAGFRAAHNLWWAAWNEVPAASLPDDDRRLARMADFGTNVAGWLEIKDEALHGFVKCSDGRLYHEFLAGVAIHSWEQLGVENRVKARARDRMRKFRERHADVRGNENPSLEPSLESTEKTKHARRRAKRFAKNGNGSDGPAPIDPKYLGHGDVCQCANCTRWAAQQREA